MGSSHPGEDVPHMFDIASHVTHDEEQSVVASPIIHDDEIRASSTDTSVVETPLRRFGDLSGIVQDQPLAQVGGEAAAAISQATAEMASNAARSLPDNPFVSVDARMKRMEQKQRSHDAWAADVIDRIVQMETAMIDMQSRHQPWHAAYVEAMWSKDMPCMNKRLEDMDAKLAAAMFTGNREGHGQVH